MSTVHVIAKTKAGRLRLKQNIYFPKNTVILNVLLIEKVISTVIDLSENKFIIDLHHF